MPAASRGTDGSNPSSSSGESIANLLSRKIRVCVRHAAQRRVKNLEPQWRFCFPTAVEFDPETDRIIVADSMRNRLQVYQKVRNYSDFQANL